MFSAPVAAVAEVSLRVTPATELYCERKNYVICAPLDVQRGLGVGSSAEAEIFHFFSSDRFATDFFTRWRIWDGEGEGAIAEGSKCRGPIPFSGF